MDITASAHTAGEPAGMDADFDLHRFVAAQAPVYAQVLAELARGRKTGHWMWFVFPQLRGLGHSAMAQRYGIASLDEARAYLAHPLLGPRLHACTQRVLAIDGRSAHAIFGTPDDLKFRSCMTLFQRAAHERTVPAAPDPFGAALQRWFDGSPDPLTLERLADAAA